MLVYIAWGGKWCMSALRNAKLNTKDKLLVAFAQAEVVSLVKLPLGKIGATSMEHDMEIP